MRQDNRWRAAAGVIAVLGVACGAPSDEDDRGRAVDTDSGSTPTDTDPIDTDPPTTPVEPLDQATVDAIVAAGERFAVEVAALDFAPVEAAVDSMESREEPPACPEIQEVPLGPAWTANCTTSEGWRFYGNFVIMINEWDLYLADLAEGVLATWGALVQPGWTMPEPAPVPTVTGYSAICSVDRGGNALTLSGVYHDFEVDLADLRVEQLRLDGAVNDPAQTDTWVARGLVPNLTRTVVAGASGGGLLLLHGAVAGLPVELDTVWVADLSLGNAAMADACPSEPVGMFAVREPGGDWYDLVFDGDAGGPCDGCATILRAGAAVGTACLDLSPLLNLTAGSNR